MLSEITTQKGWNWSPIDDFQVLEYSREEECHVFRVEKKLSNLAEATLY